MRRPSRSFGRISCIRCLAVNGLGDSKRIAIPGNHPLSHALDTSGIAAVHNLHKESDVIQVEH
jgi:hypothetical protein